MSDLAGTTTKAAVLRALHVPGKPLVLPNAWDAASARMVEEAGFAVIATSSFATAEVLGYDDGEQTPVEDVLAAAARIARAVSVPVTVDFERGYRLAPAELVERLAETGAVGLNLEDSHPSSEKMIDPAEQSEFLAAVRAAAVSLGVDLVINARTDSFLRRSGSPDEQLSSSIDRGTRYFAAGADSVYPIAAGDPDVIRALVAGIPGPINVGYGQGPPVAGRARRTRSRPGELWSDAAAAPVQQIRRRSVLRCRSRREPVHALTHAQAGA